MSKKKKIAGGLQVKTCSSSHKKCLNMKNMYDMYDPYDIKDKRVNFLSICVSEPVCEMSTAIDCAFSLLLVNVEIEDISYR